MTDCFIVDMYENFPTVYYDAALIQLKFNLIMVVDAVQRLIVITCINLVVD